MRSSNPALTLIALLGLLVAGLPAHALEEGELLEPGKAFQMEAEATAPDRVEAHFDVAEGYYLYRDRIEFSLAGDGARLDATELPPGHTKQDDLFGEVTILDGSFDAGLALAGEDLAGRSVTLRAKYQGCAEAGVCYPPIEREIDLALPAGGSATAEIAAMGEAMDAGGGFLEPDQAFAPEVTAGADGIHVHFDIADGHYLYRDKIELGLAGDTPVTAGEADIPAGKEKNDPFFGLIHIFEHSLDLTLPVGNPSGSDQPVTLVLGYQGCSEAGLCYPPEEKRFDVTVPAGASTAAAAPAEDGAPAGSDPAKAVDGAAANDDMVSEQDRIAATLAGGNFWLVVATFLGFGLLLAFTPCVFPMIPILSGIIAGQGAGITTRKAFTLSLVYVLAMAVTYTVAGVLAGLFGSNIQAAFQNPWIIASFAAIFVALSLSMFGFYDLQLPHGLQSRLTEISNKQEGGSLIGVAIMGLLSALIVGPCVAPPLAGALIYIGQTGDAVLGGSALFAMSLGMGLPLIAIGTSAGKFLPKAGGWMDAVKAVFGVLMLAVAVWMLSRILPGTVTLALWAVLVIVSAVYMGAMERIPEDASGWRRLWKGLGVVLLVYGALMLIGVAAGGKNPMKPLAVLDVAGGGQATEQAHLDFERVADVDALEARLAQAAEAGQPVMLDYYADWCVSCKEMEEYTFSDPGVQALLDDVLLLQADVTANSAADKALLQRFDLFGPPAILFFDADGNERKNYRVVGFMKAEAFREHARKALEL